MVAKAVPEHVRWAVERLSPGPDDQLLEIGCGPGVAVALISERLMVLAGTERFDKVFAMNVNLFWVRSPAKELDLLKRLLDPGGALYLFYGYGGRRRQGKVGENTSRIPEALTEHLTERGFTVEVQPGPGMVCVVASLQ